MPENWKTYKLGNISEVIMGQSPKGATTNNSGEGLPLLNGPTEFGCSHPTPTQFTIDPKKVSQIGDLLFCVRGSTTGRMNFSDQPYAIGRGIGAFRGKNGFSTKYIKYLIDFYLDRMLALCTGSTFPNLSRSDLENFNVKSCSPKESNSIASILSALDDKIELNLQMNKTLEEMAMALYKHWFVDFGPFQDGEFVDFELGKIPKGWEVKKLKDFAKLVMGQSPKSEFYNNEGNGKPFHQGVKDYGLRFPNDQTYSAAGNREAKEGDILFSVRAPVGRLNIAKNDIILGRGLAAMRMENNNSFLFYSLKRMFTIEDSIGSGTVFNSVNKTELQNLMFVIPPADILSEFKSKVEPLDLNYLSNTLEIQTITKLRDTLLPKLISGEVRVKDAEKTLSEVL